MTHNNTKSKSEKYSLVNFTNTIITQLYINHQHKSWQHYRATINSFMRYRHNKDISLRKINTNIIESYEAYLKRQNVCRNTSSFYMRILRAIYNRAVDQRLVRQQYPFRRVYTGIDKTRKRAIHFNTIKQICRLNLPQAHAMDMARDAFLASFFLRGISFVDLAHLRKSDLRNGFLHYNRSKTRQQIIIRWEPQMQAIVDKYKHITHNSPYLFPFIIGNGDKPATDNQQYHNAEMRIAYNLKKIRHLLGITENLTMYVARHSWASAAHSLHQPISLISSALGHDSETTTQIYLRSFQSSDVDNLNAKILSEITIK